MNVGNLIDLLRQLNNERDVVIEYDSSIMDVKCIHVHDTDGPVVLYHSGFVCEESDLTQPPVIQMDYSTSVPIAENRYSNIVCHCYTYKPGANNA